jgi:two-component sensor histidine kinase
MQGRLVKLNDCLLSFGVNPEKNINSLLELCFNELHPAGIFYNYSNEKTYSASKWDPLIDANDLNNLMIEFLDDFLNTVQSTSKIITNLHETKYALNNPSILKYKLRTLLATPLVINDSICGALWLVYQGDTISSEDDQKFMAMIGSAISIENERRASDDVMRSSLSEREILFKELLHRVKNNLQVLSSLLYLQSMDLEDEKLISLFQENTSRIRSMSLVYEKLFQSADFTNLNFSDYVNGLVKHILDTYSTGIQISTRIEMDDIYLAADTAITCGLLLHEILTNSVKYAFPKNFSEPAEIKISLQANKGEFILYVADNGTGFPENVDFENMPQTLGLKLINLLTSQLYGKIKLVRDNGTKYQITFSEKI